MNNCHIYLRVLFGTLFVLIGAFLASSLAPQGQLITYMLSGAVAGALLIGLLIGSEALSTPQTSLTTAALLLLGILLGLALGSALLALLSLAVTPFYYSTSPLWHSVLTAITYLSSCYYVTMALSRLLSQSKISIPFFNTPQEPSAGKQIFIDSTALQDPRLIDLAASGLLDKSLCIAAFTIDELHRSEVQEEDETTRHKLRRSQEVIDKLMAMPKLGLKILSADETASYDTNNKLYNIVKALNAYLLISDVSATDESKFEGVHLISLNALAKALKPLSQSGETIQIKIQHYGKGTRQGVGYLDDGTMVVVNGGANYIGESIKAQVLSVKHTTSGRMIFCNAIDEAEADANSLNSYIKNRPYQEEPASSKERDKFARRYFAME